MGNQAHAGEPIRRAVRASASRHHRSGARSPLLTNKTDLAASRCCCLAERKKFAGQSKPADLEMDLWLGPASMRDYNACYVPFKWRGWWDFGTGALGDMACHIMDMPYWALEPGLTRVGNLAESGGATTETGPPGRRSRTRFPALQSVGGERAALL